MRSKSIAEPLRADMVGLCSVEINNNTMDLETKEDKSQIKDPPAASKGKEIKKKALGAAAAITTGTAVLVNGVFGSPEEMLNLQNEANKPAIIHYVEEETEPEEEDFEEDEEEEGPLSLRERFRRWVWSWPFALRVLIGLPLWAGGWGICQLAQLLWSSLLGPVFKVVCSILTLGAVLAGIMGLAGRALFPELPLREVFKKSRLIGLGISAAILEILLHFLPLISPDLAPYAGLIRFLGGAIILAGLLLSMWVTKERRRRYVLSKAV